MDSVCFMSAGKRCVELDRSVASPPGIPSLSETEKVRKGITRMVNVLAGEAQNAGG